MTLAPQACLVECLGLTFENEAARRDYFLKILAGKLDDPGFRQTPGFPLGDKDDILRYSDPPYFTLCPNPFIADWITQTGRDARETSPAAQPYAGPWGSQERHPVYAYQPYHAKAPPAMIRRLIEHYTQPGDLVLDGFSGSGMTGVAAREAGRWALLFDLSPMAAFTGLVNCASRDWQSALTQMQAIIRASQTRYGAYYQTQEAGERVEVNYYVWSDLFTCPECAFEFPFFPHGVIHHGDKVETRPAFACPACGAPLNVRRIERVLAGGEKQAALAWVNAGRGKKRIKRAPSDFDLALCREIEAHPGADWFPVDKIDPGGYSARLAQLGDKAISDVSKFLSRRNRLIFADLWQRVGQIADPGIRSLCFSALTSIFTVISERQGYFGGGGGMSGNLYMPIVRMEKNIYAVLKRKLKRLAAAERAKAGLPASVLVSTQSSDHLTQVPDQSIDYIYTDPPFGANIIYSEMNLMLEAWLKVKTNDRYEAVINHAHPRGFEQYAALMRACFREYYRVLKAGHWITVEFHNTQAGVWDLIQTCIGESGLVIAGIGFLDKGSTTILEDIRPGAARYDLMISAYRPGQARSPAFVLAPGSPDQVWDIVREELRRAPLPEGPAFIPARAAPMLFDRVVAFHLRQGQSLPLSMPDFLAGLRQRFPEQQGMFFLPD